MTSFRLASQALFFIGRRPLLLMLLSLAGGMLLWRPWKTDAAETEPATSEWVAVEPRLLEQRLGLVGRIQPSRQETLGAPFEGVIREVLAREGQSVDAGQVLIRLDPGKIDIQLRQAQAELLKAQREANQLRNWDSSSDVFRARRAVQTARTTLENTETNLRDTRMLFARGIVARMEVDTMAQLVRTQQQDLLAAQEELHIVETRGQGVDREIVEMELVNAQARHQALLAQRDRQAVTAPFAGFVARPSVPDGGKALSVQPGVLVSQGTPLLSVTGREHIQVLSRVEEMDLHRLRVGMPVQIAGDGFAGQVLGGHIESIAVQGNAMDVQGAAAYYDVVASVDASLTDLSKHVRLGMSARLTVILYRNEQGIAVPPDALRIDADGASYVLYRATLDALPSKIVVKPGQAIAQGVEVQGLDVGYVQTGYGQSRARAR
ncbi:HlyD family efflux transporter periplasmic adaptor subunit [Achromobacter pestifer]|uniref:HlyD family efflux transporter periplasmic adaptor subunit n=1 Tax=Achromobacter pestifer TaxID=1353889 RepID=A0A7D4HUB5_9BURK|nr:HlyD family efflux transporter periplasmic adaptor subunit [Achromobacter pestifer]QKH36733.1 HlyD family efflux transporter periplasmic adaptor subunit [Achromobacter pestifer]